MEPYSTHNFEYCGQFSSLHLKKDGVDFKKYREGN